MTQPKTWNGVFHQKFYERAAKPRTLGLNVVIDRALGINALADLLDTAGDAIDQIKFAFGTSFALNAETVRKKIEMIRARGIDVYPGGTLGEAAIMQGVLPEYIARVVDLGFTAVEISDGTIHLPSDERACAIRAARAANLKVITEVGKKDPRHQPSVGRMRAQIAADFDEGASYVVIEARESGRGVGIYDMTGAVNQSELHALVQGLKQLDRLIWEAPQTGQQAFLIAHFGANVNLGNIATLDVLALEALRAGLRFETLRPIAAERGLMETDEDMLARFLAAANNTLGS